MGIWHIAFSTATTNEDERAAAATREKREKKHFKWIKYTLTLCFCLSRAARPRVIVCVCDIVSAEKKMANCHAFPLCVWYSSLQLVSCLCAILQAIQLILSVCIFLAIPLQQSELCFYYYCVSVGFALCDIPFFLFFLVFLRERKPTRIKIVNFVIRFKPPARASSEKKQKKKAGMIFKAQSPIAVCVCVCVCVCFYTFIRVKEKTNKQKNTNRK